MKIEIPTMNGFIPDCYGKFANADQKIDVEFEDIKNALKGIN